MNHLKRYGTQGAEVLQQGTCNSATLLQSHVCVTNSYILHGPHVPDYLGLSLFKYSTIILLHLTISLQRAFSIYLASLCYLGLRLV